MVIVTGKKKCRQQGKQGDATSYCRRVKLCRCIFGRDVQSERRPDEGARNIRIRRASTMRILREHSQYIRPRRVRSPEPHKIQRRHTNRHHPPRAIRFDFLQPISSPSLAVVIRLRSCSLCFSHHLQVHRFTVHRHFLCAS
jgi:hypothetical protein